MNCESRGKLALAYFRFVVELSTFLYDNAAGTETFQRPERNDKTFLQSTCFLFTAIVDTFCKMSHDLLSNGLLTFAYSALNSIRVFFLLVYRRKLYHEKKIATLFSFQERLSSIVFQIFRICGDIFQRL